MSAQSEPGRQENPPFEIIYAGRGRDIQETEASSETTVSGQDVLGNSAGDVPANQAADAVQLSAEQVARVRQSTARLVAQSRDAWMRGLMDQSSYEAWLDIAATVQLRVARHQGDEKRAVQALRDQVVLWSEAAERLERFDQPASHGWRADLAHAQVMALRAKFRYSIATDRELSEPDELAYAELAQRHLDLRRQEFQTGTGTAANVLSAARLVDERVLMPEEVDARTSEKPSALEKPSPSIASFQMERPTALRRAVDEIRQPVYLVAYPLAISVRDLNVDRSAMYGASQLTQFLETPADDRDASRFLTELDQNADDMASLQLARYQTGTATPGGMLQQWWLDESLADSIVGDEVEPGSTYRDYEASQTRRLQQIHQLAVSMQDRRGRNSADVAAAETLWEFRQLGIESFADRRQQNVAVATPEPASDSVVVFGQDD